ncbi:MAG: cytochrome c [Myxococcaceae bacterium]
MSLCSLGLLASCGEEIPTARSTPVGTKQPGTPRANPIWGGTLLVTHHDLAVVADADHDKLFVTPMTTGRVAAIALPEGSSPFRMAEDSNGNVQVVLRGTGELAVVDPNAKKILSHTAVCPEPRGVTFDTTHQTTVVACEGGELVKVGLDGSQTVFRPGIDLRDPVAIGSQVWVSSFRAATAIAVASDGTPAVTVTPPSIGFGTGTFVPGVVWKSLATADGDLVLVHQREVDGPVTSIQLSNAPPVPYYSNACDSPVVRSALSIVHQGTVVASVETAANDPVDATLSPKAGIISIASPSQNSVTTTGLPAAGETSGGLCVSPGASVSHQVSGMPVGVGYTSDGTLVVHEREPFQIEFFPPDAQGVPSVKPTFTVGLANYTAEHDQQTGFNLFHTATSGGIACMSCHPEAGDDGHVWGLFEGSVRTQTLKGGLTPTAPFHWKGELTDMTALLGETFVHRMGGTMPSAEVTQNLGDWLDRVPASRPSITAPSDVLAKGESLFNSAGCASCHTGAALTNNTTVDVGTGGAFQVPSLRGVAARGPWLHDGCAKTLEDRFGACGGGAKHGSTGSLTPGDVSALVAYLRSL